MRMTVAHVEYHRWAMLHTMLMHKARQVPGWQEPDARNLRTWRSLLLAILATRTTRLIALGRALLPTRAARTAKAAAQGIGYFLAHAQVRLRPLSTRLLVAALSLLPTEQIATYRGRAIVALDPTTYRKRSRGRRRGMQYIGRVRKSTTKVPTGERAATMPGYVDVWAGLVLRGKLLLPLARRLFSSAHPTARSQNRVEQAVLHGAVGLLRTLGWPRIVVADRGLGRKELLIDLAQRGQDFVLRLAPDILATPEGGPSQLLRALLDQQPWRGQVVWDRGEDGPLSCRVRSVTAAIVFSRSGRKDDRPTATLGFIEAQPVDATGEPDPTQESLVLATTLPVRTLADLRGIVHVYSLRWSIETGFETLKAWGLERFMVRTWEAIDRLLWVVTIAYVLALLAARLPVLAPIRRWATERLREWSVLGRHLTIGKLAEALALDFATRPNIWYAVWLL